MLYDIFESRHRTGEKIPTDPDERNGGEKLEFYVAIFDHEFNGYKGPTLALRLVELV